MNSIRDEITKFELWVSSMHNKVDDLTIEELEEVINYLKTFTTTSCTWTIYDATQYILERATDRLGELEYETTKD